MHKTENEWQKLAEYKTNLQAELHANLLKNNNINVSIQPLSVIPGLNSGAVLWVHHTNIMQAKRILANIATMDADADKEE